MPGSTRSSHLAVAGAFPLRRAAMLCAVVLTDAVLAAAMPAKPHPDTGTIVVAVDWGTFSPGQLDRRAADASAPDHRQVAARRY
jgi:hypothetical protein